MSTEISTQLKTVQDRVRDRIQTEFMNLIPQEVWEKMVAAEIAAFMSKPVRDRWGNLEKGQTTTLHEMIQEALNKAAKDRIDKELASDRWTGHFDGTQYAAGEAIKKMVVDQGDLIMKTMMVGMMEAMSQMVLQQFRQQLQQWNPGMRTF